MRNLGQESGEAAEETSGPFRFVTRRLFRHADGRVTHWYARHHRKGLQLTGHGQPLRDALLRCLWVPSKINWWIGTVFAIGASLFVAASALYLAPAFAERLGLDSGVLNAIFFAGSIPFTLAAYLQLLQAANQRPYGKVQEAGGRPFYYFGWRPNDVGWLSCALQFVGTVFFNVNTLDAMVPSLNWFQYDVAVWIPNIVGSILFMISGYLAFTEVCHGIWDWHPRSISWWALFINLIGCAAFLVSGILSLIVPGVPTELLATFALACTLCGAICFLAGAILLLVESEIGTE